MNKKHKAQFDLINNSLWLLIKNKIKDGSEYKNAMSEILKLYIKYDEKEKFTDEWWESVISDFENHIDKYKGTKIESFIGDFGLSLCDYWEFESKNKSTNLDFYKYVCKAFVNEWEKISEKENKEKTT